MAFASSSTSSTAVDNSMFDVPPANHAERYAKNSSAPAPGLSPRDTQCDCARCAEKYSHQMFAGGTPIVQQRCCAIAL
eukprot:5068928-Amphidinium_carterae.1